MADAAPAALITGATSGLGRYLARQLASSGWQVLAHGRDPARVADLAAELGGGARGYVADLAWLGDVRALAALVRAEVPRLDVLVNNAGIGFGAPGEGRRVSADGHELRFAVNYLAPVLLTRLLVPLLTASARSRIVNRPGRIQDRRVRERPLVDADPLGEAVPQIVIGQQGRSAVGVVNDRDLEVRALRCLGLHQVAGVGDVLDDGRSDPAPDVPLHERLA